LLYLYCGETENQSGFREKLIAQLAYYFEPHGSSSASDNVESGVFAFGVKIGFFDFADLEDLLASYFSDLVLVRNA
jgi:hypothetical protein